MHGIAFLLLQIQFHFYVLYAVFGKFAGYLPKAYLFIQSAGIRLRLNRYFFCGELFFYGVHRSRNYFRSEPRTAFYGDNTLTRSLNISKSSSTLNSLKCFTVSSVLIASRSVNLYQP